MSYYKEAAAMRKKTVRAANSFTAAEVDTALEAMWQAPKHLHAKEDFITLYTKFTKMQTSLRERAEKKEEPSG